MCEILTLKHNTEGLRFQEEDIKDALTANKHGCGYVIFEQEGDRFEIKETHKFDCFDYSKDTDEDAYDDTEDFTIIDYKKDFTRRMIMLETFSGPCIDMEMPKGMHRGSHIDKIEAEIELYCKQYALEIDLDKTRKHTSHRTTYEIGFANTGNANKAVKILYNKQKTLKPNQIMIMHFRNATTGYTQANTQPIVQGNYMVIHNGVFNGDLIKDNDFKSDTTAFTELLNSLYKKAKGQKQLQEKKIITKLLEQVDGWYSMFIYSWKTGKLYYRKEGASFNTAYEGIMMSTKEQRFPIMYTTQSSMDIKL